MTSQSKEEMALELAALTDAARRLSRLHGSLGLDYPKTASFTAPRPNASAYRAPLATKPLPSQTAPAPAKKPPAPIFPSKDIEALKDTIDHCERCVAEEKRPTPLFGKGRQDRPTLLIVGDVASQEGVAQDNIFPGGQGELLGKMLAAINLGMDDVFMTNIIRCAFDSHEIALENQLKNCRPHLLEQINLFRPVIICTMGQLASQALLATQNKLIALRGRFHQLNNIPLMATYHPSQLLQVPDLKKAAWYDLQLIQHKLKQLQKA